MGFFNKLFGKKEKESLDQGLQKTKEGFFAKITKAIAGKSTVDEEVLDNLEEALVGADVGQLLARASEMAANAALGDCDVIGRNLAARVGATPKPQLPITVVVTPCHGEMVSMRSHRIWAS